MDGTTGGSQVGSSHVKRRVPIRDNTLVSVEASEGVVPGPHRGLRLFLGHSAAAAGGGRGEAEAGAEAEARLSNRGSSLGARTRMPRPTMHRCRRESLRGRDLTRQN